MSMVPLANSTKYIETNFYILKKSDENRLLLSYNQVFILRCTEL